MLYRGRICVLLTVRRLNNLHNWDVYWCPSCDITQRVAGNSAAVSSTAESALACHSRAAHHMHDVVIISSSKLDMVLLRPCSSPICWAQAYVLGVLI
jgi:hypothetical protein